MKYVNTRGTSEGGVSSAYAIKKGLCDGGGLYMPEEIPEIDGNFIASLIPMSYPERAAAVLSLFLTDYSYDELYEDACAAYSKEKFTPSPAPISEIRKGEYMLELWHGPTSAFKDMALQIMPRLFVRALKKCGESRKALILVATSGDTGKAALEGYRDVEGTAIKVFYPIDGVSRVQKKQMRSQEGGNVSVVGIEGNFDDAQNGVKKIFSDGDFAKELDGAGVFLSSANSINWGRLVPQIVYYVSAYCDLCRDGKINAGERINVCVPTGNFGNIFAGYIAKRMGVPIGTLVCASNKNDVLTHFLRKGEYDRNREFHKTISPSMDILISSNLERLLYLCLGSERTAEYMAKLAKDGKYCVSKEELALIRESFEGYSTDEEGCRATVKRVYEKDRRLIDTHTAVAVSAAERFMNEKKTAESMLVVSTASPYKFASDVYFSITEKLPDDDLDAPEMLQKLTGVKMPEPLAKVLSMKEIHTEVIAREEMTEAVRKFVSR